MNDYEAMAIAVLKGDMTAARALADKICEDHEKGVQFIRPTLTVKKGRLRVAVFVSNRASVAQGQMEMLKTHIGEWLRGEKDKDKIMVLSGVDRIELYEVDNQDD